MRSLISKNFSIFLFGSGFNGLFPIFLVPIYTTYLNTEEFGLVMLYLISSVIITSLIGLSTHGAVYKKYLELSEKEFSSFIVACLVLVSMFVSIFVVILFILNDFFLQIFKVPDKLGCFWYLVLVPSFFVYMLQLKSSIYQIQKKSISFVFLQTSRNIFLGVFVLYMYLDDSFTLLNLLASLALSQIISGLASFSLLVKENLKNEPVKLKAHLRDLLKFGIPMIPTSLKDHILSFSDRFFLISFIGLSVLGFYSLSFQLASIILIITTAFNNAFTPFFFDLLRKECNGAKRKVIFLSYLYFLLVALIALLIYIGSKFYLLNFVGSAYEESLDYLLPAVLSFMFIGFHGVVVNYIYYTHKTVIYGVFNIFIIILNIVLNLVLIGEYGANGVAYATLITSVVMFSMTIVLSNYLYPMPWLTFYKKDLK